jgi:hypothetical protein
MKMRCCGALWACTFGLALAMTTVLLGPAGAAEIRVVLSPQAAPAVRSAAQELAGYLQQLYPQDRFTLGEQLPPSGRAILVGSVPGDPRLKALLAAKPTQPESYVVTTAHGDRLGIIAGADSRGVVYGVYALLEKLGCGFYLSYDAIAAPRREPFSLDGWQLADRPLVPTRLVFNWHNFLSGCSTWNLPEWKAWTVQSQKQGYNAVMVHAYGNNPMVSFTFNGKTKPVGYLSTTVKGRDWSTMHVNDVRRLWGGEMFQQPVFGSDAALVPDDRRTAAAQKLMRDAFTCAREREMRVFFADDVDTISANPQELILTLPPQARFATASKAGPVWLANPDTPEGYRYYRAQIESLLTAYPQITCLVAWFRNGGTPWMDLKITEMPAAWQEEYQAEIAKTPAAAKLWHSHNLFAIGKILRAFDRALAERGHDRVELATGTWHFDFLPAADRFLPQAVKFLGLDYGILHDQSQLGTPERLEMLAAVGAHREVIPVIWAQHDDGNYIGRPYTPFAAFDAKLVAAKAGGFGIIHWTTRPLDLFFSSHAKQVWQTTKDQPLRTTCNDMAARSFGTPAQQKMGEYLERWVTDAPKFARETSDRFIDRQLTDIPEVLADCGRRLRLIDAVDAATLTPQQRDRLSYVRGLEQFIAAIYQTQEAFQMADGAWKKGQIGAARTMMANCRPEPVIEQFAKLSALGGMTRGERGLLVSMNTRWLSHYVRLRQSLGIEPLRYCFGPTSHDPLAQAPGRFTFYFDSQRHLWQTLGTEESGGATFVLPGDAKISTAGESAGMDEGLFHRGIESDKPLTLTLQPIMYKGPLRPGQYALCLWMLDPTSTAAGQRVFEVSVNSAAQYDYYAFEPVKAAYLRLECHGNSDSDWNSIQEVKLGSLARDGKAPLATASAAVKGYPAEHAVDGRPETRWAARGQNEWIQFRLDPQAVTSGLGISWYVGGRRRAKFEVAVSNDGHHWTRVDRLHPAAAPALATARVDIFKEVGQANRVLSRRFPVTVGPDGTVAVSLTPVVGKAIVCAAVLEPSEAATHDSPRAARQGN